MKRMVWFLVLAGFAVGFAGCHKNDKKAEPHKTHVKKERVKKERVKKEHKVKARREKKQHKVVDEA